jgi:hypothetical protein
MTEALPPPMALFRMASGFYVSRAIYVAAENERQHGPSDPCPVLTVSFTIGSNASGRN